MAKWAGDRDVSSHCSAGDSEETVIKPRGVCVCVREILSAGSPVWLGVPFKGLERNPQGQL